MFSKLSKQVKFYPHQQGLKSAAHFVLFIAAYYLSFGFRFNFSTPPDHRDFFLLTLPIIVSIQMIIFWRFGIFKASWHYVGSRDLINLFKVSLLSTATGMLIIYSFLLREGFSRSILAM